MDLGNGDVADRWLESLQVSKGQLPWAENYADLWQTKLTAGLGGVEEAVSLRA